MYWKKFSWHHRANMATATPSKGRRNAVEIIAV
jgi:hypothetical protein